MRDIAHDLNAVIPANVENNDDAVEMNINPNWDIIQGINFQILSNPSGIFAISNSKLIISDRSSVISGNYTVSVRVTDGSYWDDFKIYVESVATSNCVFINHSYTGTEDGTRDHPYKSINTPAYKSDCYYFVARSTHEAATQQVLIATGMMLGAYGKGSRPILSFSSENEFYFGLYISASSNDAVIRDLRIRHRGSRTIEIDAADRITIDNCYLGNADNGRADIAIRSDGLTSYTKILNCRIDSVNSDGIYLENEFAEIAYNTITNVSIKNEDGDGIQLNLNSYKAHVHHNYIDMGAFVTGKGVIANTQGQGGTYSMDSYAVIENNILIGSPGYATFGICGTGRYDTVRSNYIYVAQSAVEAAGVNLEDGGYIANNIIKGWSRGCYVRGDDMIIYNNNITDCLRGIDANSEASSVCQLKNNIFYNVDECFIFTASGNTMLTSDYNSFMTNSDAKWIIKGSNYYTLKELQNAGYDPHSMLTDPNFVNNNSNYQLAAGSPCIDKGINLVNYDYLNIPRPQGSASEIGAFEFQVTGTAVPAAPSSLTSTKQTTSSVDLKWTDNSTNENGCKIYRSSSLTGEYADVGTTSADVTTYTNSGLQSGTTYHYKIKAYNGIGYSDFSSPLSVATLTLQLPNVPIGLTATEIGKDYIKLQWDDNSDNENGFELVRSNSENNEFVLITTTKADITAYIDDLVVSGMSYKYKIRAFNNDGYSAFSTDLMVTIPGSLLPEAPDDLAAIKTDKNYIELQWKDNSGNEKGFQIHRWDSVTNEFVQIASLSFNTITYTDASLHSGTRYQYKVRAFNDAGFSDFSPVLTVITRSPLIPYIPIGFRVQTVDSGLVELVWEDQSDLEDGFVIERRGPDDFDLHKVFILDSNTTFFADKDIQVYSVYQYFNRAFNQDGFSDYSSSVQVTIPGHIFPPAPPSSLESKNFTDKSITVLWTDNSYNERGFIINRSPVFNPDDTTSILVNANVTEYIDDNLMPNTTYVYTVRAINEAGNSTSSNKNLGSTLSVAETKRIKGGLVAYYNFNYDPDNIILDLSGYEEPLNLTVLESYSISWNKNKKISLETGSAITSTKPAKKIINAVKQNDELSVECWILPSEPDFNPDSRIISLGSNDADIGFVLDQEYSAGQNNPTLRYGARLHTESTNASGYPKLNSGKDIPYINLMHIVYVRDKTGNEKLYIDGEILAEGYRPSSLGSWNDSYYLRLGNESDLNLSWKGSMYLLAIYSRALASDEIAVNYSVGPCDSLQSSETAFDLTVYPNPSTDWATIEIVPKEKQNIVPQTVITLLDAYGKVYFEEIVFNPTIRYSKTINVKAYSKGLYFIRILSGDQQNISKLIIR